MFPDRIEWCMHGVMCWYWLAAQEDVAKDTAAGLSGEGLFVREGGSTAGSTHTRTHAHTHARTAFVVVVMHSTWQICSAGKLGATVGRMSLASVHANMCTVCTHGKRGRVVFLRLEEGERSKLMCRPCRLFASFCVCCIVR